MAAFFLCVPIIEKYSKNVIPVLGDFHFPEFEVPALVSVKPCANCGKEMHLKTKKSGQG